MKNNIPVSVVMTAYNRENYIGEAIESVLQSDYKEFELIIVDDCSKDKTGLIIKEWALKDRRIKYHINEKNLGQFENRNRAIDLAVGEFIITADSDDMIFPFTISYLLESMNEFPLASFGMFCNGIQKNKCLEASETIHEHFFKTPILIQGPGATIFKKIFFHSIGGYTNEYGVPGDMYFNLKAASASPLVLLSRLFMYYRRHEGQEINNIYSYLLHNYRYMRDALVKLDMHLSAKEIAWLDKKNKRRFSVNILKYYFTTGNFSKTRDILNQAEFGLRDFIQGIFH